MCTPSAPSAPNYQLAAQQTSAGNQNAAISQQIGNMTNQAGVEQYKLDPTTGAQVLGADGKPIKLGGTGVTYDNPYADLDARGSIKFDMSSLTQKQIDTYNAGGGLPKDFVKTYLPEQWTQQSVLGGNDRTLYDQSQAAQLGLSEIALKGLDAVRAATDPTDPRNKSVKPEIAVQGGPNNTAAFMDKGVYAPSFTGGGLNTSGLQSSVNNAGDIQSTVGNNAGQIQTNANANQQAGGLASKLNNSASIQTNLGLDPTLLNQQATDALYKANTQYLDPQFAQSQAKMESQLANQGITRGSEAYNNAMLNFNNQKQQAYEGARNQAIGQGTAAAQGLFGMGLQGAQFGNTSLGQQFGQNVTAQQLANASAGQNNANAQANMGLTNAALGQQFGQNVTAANFANAAQGQQYGQNLSDMQAQNAAVNQRFGMDTSNQASTNNAQQQQFNAAIANANLNNEQLSQLYNQQLQSAQLSNQASNQQLAQNQAIQQNPLNILQALRTGAQLNTANLPQVGTSQPGQLANWQGADMLGAVTAQGQYDQSVYNAQAAANAQMMSAGIGAAGALGGAGIKAASDRRLKKNIKRIGTHVLGIGLYTWDYLWGQPFSGVMADEVEQVMPEAIVMHPSGFKMVNYSMLGLL
jgi:hypothetical protein